MGNWKYIVCMNRIYSIFSKSGTHFLSRLAEARRRPVLSCLVLLCLVGREINHSHTCSWLLAKLFALGLHTVLGNHQISAKYEMDIHIHLKSWYVENYQKSRQGKTRQNQARHGRYKVFCVQYTRKITVAYIKYFMYNAICWNNVAYCITWCNKLGKCGLFPAYLSEKGIYRLTANLWSVLRQLTDGNFTPTYPYLAIIREINVKLKYILQIQEQNAKLQLLHFLIFQIHMICRYMHANA